MTIHMSTRCVALSVTLGALLAFAPATAGAQSAHGRATGSGMAGMAGMSGMAGDTADPAASSATMSMSGHLMETAHMRMTPRRPENAADDARADSIAAELRSAIAKYTDVQVALRDGYRPFLPNVPQHIYHFTNAHHAIAAQFRFDPAAPTSLLYEKHGDSYTLVGAMYTAPRTASLDALNARVPLSVGQWHEHVNLCVPRRGDRARWAEQKDGKPLFGPDGTITTADACAAADGRFFPQLFGWMIHVHPFATSRGSVWAADHSD
ncbi:MAG TPA: hypothetical protein VFJ96_13790 [Gemmatimonadaceae bacterium]|nr:hypothetical protein [Gemmatimonadaceae bacterium]